MDHTLDGRLRMDVRDDALGRWMVAWCPPHPSLRDVVAMLWYGEGRVSYQRDRILPLGGSQLLINLGPTQYRIESGPPERRIPFEDVWYSGLHQSPIDTEAPHGSALFGVAFKASGARPWLGVDADELSDRITPLADLIGCSALVLREALLETPGMEARFALVEAWIAARLDPRCMAHPLLQWALARIEGSNGLVTVETLAKDAGVSRKHLAGLFRQQVGLGAKSLARIHRFRGAVSMLASTPCVPWVELAVQCGYYDQSHLVRDFRAFSGYSPSEFACHAMVDGGSVVVR